MFTAHKRARILIWHIKNERKINIGIAHEFYNVAADTEYQRNMRLVATPIESMTKVLSLIIVIQLMINIMPLPFVGLYMGLSARKTSKPDINVQRFVKRADLTDCWHGVLLDLLFQPLPIDPHGYIWKLINLAHSRSCRVFQGSQLARALKHRFCKWNNFVHQHQCFLQWMPEHVEPPQESFHPRFNSGAFDSLNFDWNRCQM